MLHKASRVGANVFGPQDFWRQMKSLFNLARMDGRTYRLRGEEATWLTYEEWDHLFEAAVESGIMAVLDDGNGNPFPQFVNPAAIGLLRTWRAMQKARGEGLSALEFARQYHSQIDADEAQSRQKSQDDDRKAVQRRESAADDMRSRKNEQRKMRDVKHEAAGGW